MRHPATGEDKMEETAVQKKEKPARKLISKRERIKLKKERKLKNWPKQFSAKGKHLRCPPSKARLLAGHIKGMKVEDALNLMRNSPTSAAKLITKTLYSAMHNALNAERSPEIEDIVVDKIMVDQGKSLKRHQPVSHGKAEPILKRSCHISVILKVEA
jgi:large subunit ribosomal protein L22